ncbi:MAG: SGNH hydrolase domain-containing protein [Actinobacteria bacterium]|nr:SGNH hydrolase domain-containing protein [Actinomycetota bacterium]
MKRLIITVVLISLASPLPLANAVTKVGTTCPTVNKTVVEKSSTFICLKSGSKKLWQLLTPDLKIKIEIEKAVTLSAAPKSVTSTILQARKDKSFWLDQECSVDFASTDTPVCESGDLNSKKIIVLYGDSHASMWMSALDVIAKKNGYKVRLFAKLACPLVEIPIWSYQLNKPFTECTQWQQKVYPLITALNPEIIIVTDQWKPAVVDGKKSDFDTPFMWEKEFPIAMARISKMAKKVFVLGNNPSLSQDPVDCASKPNVTLSLCSSGRTQADNAKYNVIEAKATKAVGGIYIDTVTWACTDSLCPIVINSKLAYFDQWHFSESYIKFLTPALESKLAPAFKP